MSVLAPRHTLPRRTLAPAWPIPRALPEIVTRTPPPAPTRRQPRGLPHSAPLAFAILLISLLSLLYMNEAANLATSGYNIGQLQQQRDQLQRENDQLQVQLAQLNSLPAIQQAATNTLHLIPGDITRVRYVTLDARELALAQRRGS
ncbi:MAG TPA: hypothetical protein VMV93_03625 [Chloroflexota bacterium]|nr:hypothetical protein [Chloroflexota bacterium]